MITQENFDQIMSTVYKVELIVSSEFLETVLLILDNIPVSGYTLFGDTSGKGDRGLSCDDFYCTFNGSYLMTICSEEQQLKILEEHIKPILQTNGGVCLITKAKQIKH